MKAPDIVAIIAIAGCLVLIGLDKKDPIITTTLLMVLGFYFGRVSATVEGDGSDKRRER